jgi:predicted signal transduction protein with EAL and GGDEF domain
MTLARLGSDVFGVLVTGRAHGGELLLEVTRLADQITRAIALPIHLDGQPQSHTVTVGISAFDGPGSAGDQLHQAEQAVAQGKALGRGTVHFFDPSLAEAAQQRARLEADLQLALQQGSCCCTTSPRSATASPPAPRPWCAGSTPSGAWSRRASSFRWPRPAASSCRWGSGCWSRPAACWPVAARPAAGALTLAVNVSAHQVQQPGFVLHLKQLLERSGCNPHRLKLELTESAFIGDEQTAIRAMTALRALGIRFSLDDFGTGYLAQPPQEAAAGPDQDRPVLRADLLDDPDDAAITQVITQLARNFGMEVMAEGWNCRPSAASWKAWAAMPSRASSSPDPNPCSPSRPSATNIWLRRAPALMPRA